MDFVGVIEPVKYQEEEDLPALPVALPQLEERLQSVWTQMYHTAQRLTDLFHELGACLKEIRGDDNAFAPYQQAGYETWQAYVESVLEPRMGLSYVRAVQILNAYESGEQILDTLADVERSRTAQLIAAQFNATLPKQIPQAEAPLRALAGLTAEEKTAVLGIAEKISDKEQPTFTEVKRAKALYKASEKGAIKLDGSVPLTGQAVDNALLYANIVDDLRKLPTEWLMQLEQDLADLIVERSTHGEENDETEDS